MAAWLIPALKMVLPHIGTILSVATPVFTKKKADTSSDPTLQQQIDELQSAASLSANQIKDLAEQLKSTAAAVEQVASVAESKLKTMMILCVTATVISFCLVLFLLLNQ
ncbi:MAG: hypothetical protein JW384_01319 [Nitrosomonadaceae bacterium]|nr:hypothetical protein [Nitrosospira sp.]MBI0413138.1 hypothetical protein [Nitrosospira sp.]MCG3770176.1 hypothetical protein [Nitrosomonadaceae bacterium]